MITDRETKERIESAIKECRTLVQVAKERAARSVDAASPSLRDIMREANGGATGGAKS